MNKLVQFLNRSLVVSAERSNNLLPLSRFVSTTNVAYDSKTNAIARKLGIPEKPKKPLTAYFRFLNEVRPAIKHTVKHEREVPTVAAAQWKNLDDSQKQKYIQAFEKDKAVWLKVNETYNKSLTKEQKLAIKDERIRLKEVEEERVKKTELKNRLKELGKPKRPTTAFLLFYADEAKKSKTNVQAIKAKYNALSESQKAAYKQNAAALLDEYRKSLQTWEKRMVAKGMVDLIGKKATPKKLPKLK